MLEAEVFAHSASSLTLALGKDTAGQPVIADLARMPHLMIAGATGSGKSVAINAMIMSILFKAPPREVRFVMIDLKMLELSVYEDIPHLLVPVVTDPKQAVAVLHNIVELMEERYRLMKQHGVRNIDGYNRLVDEESEAGHSAKVIELRELAGDEDDDVVTPTPMPDRLPKVVVIVDELADLMMTMGRKVEEPITRLAQKARAAGIHLIVATQRPSVDVITGLIKANFPVPHLLPGDRPGRLAHHPRPYRRRTSARSRRHALHAAGQRPPAAPAWAAGDRTGDSQAGELHQTAGRAAVRIQPAGES